MVPATNLYKFIAMCAQLPKLDRINLQTVHVATARPTFPNILLISIRILLRFQKTKTCAWLREGLWKTIGPLQFDFKIGRFLWSLKKLINKFAFLVFVCYTSYGTTHCSTLPFLRVSTTPQLECTLTATQRLYVGHWKASTLPSITIPTLITIPCLCKYPLLLSSFTTACHTYCLRWS